MTQKEAIIMSRRRQICFSFAVLATSLISLVGCVPMERVARPTLDEVRLGNARGQITADTGLRAGEIAAEVDRIDRNRREIYVIGDDGRRQTIPFDITRTHVVYHGWDYSVDNLEAGDRVAFQPVPRTVSYIETLRVLEPVQARSGATIARPVPAQPRAEVVEGTVERVDERLGTFDLRPGSGRTITVSIPYNARATDVDSFRTLRRGDRVRVEGEFVNPESLQLLAFLTLRNR
jgi:hypothetical protein